MLSEGSYKKGFTVHVPEEEFHDIFLNSLNKIFSKLHTNQIISKGFKLSYGPNKLRYLLPIPKIIPKFIFNNKKFAKIYLRIAFEAEGNVRYKILESGGTNRRIKLSRNIGIDNLIKNKLSYEEGERIYFGVLKRDFPKLADEILKSPCLTILGERLMLKKHFNIETSLYPEYLRINKTSFRRGKVSVKWTLTIHGTNINKFVKEIGFVGKNKEENSRKMLKVKLQRSAYFAFSIMKKVAKKGVFNSCDYSKEMIKLGYKFPMVFLSKYKRKNLIKNVGYHKYKVLDS